MCSTCKPRRSPGDPLPHWDAKEKHRGWHSRRHQTKEAQDTARETYLANRGRVARIARAR